MHSSLTALLHTAEDQYLESADLGNFQELVGNLGDSIAIHNTIRENEIGIFQNIADKVVKEFPETQESTIELALCNWLITLRYCTMAVVLDSREFLEIRLLDWLKDLVKVRQDAAIQSRIYQALIEQLSEILSAEQLSTIQPFIKDANNTVFSESNLDKSR